MLFWVTATDSISYLLLKNDLYLCDNLIFLFYFVLIFANVILLCHLFSQHWGPYISALTFDFTETIIPSNETMLGCRISLLYTNVFPSFAHCLLLFHMFLLLLS
jgi:hypothetical protein